MDEYAKTAHWFREDSVAGRQNKAKRQRETGHTTAELHGLSSDISSSHLTLEKLGISPASAHLS